MKKFSTKYISSHILDRRILSSRSSTIYRENKTHTFYHSKRYCFTECWIKSPRYYKANFCETTNSCFVFFLNLKEKREQYYTFSHKILHFVHFNFIRECILLSKSNKCLEYCHIYIKRYSIQHSTTDCSSFWSLKQAFFPHCKIHNFKKVISYI